MKPLRYSGEPYASRLLRPYLGKIGRLRTCSTLLKWRDSGADTTPSRSNSSTKLESETK